MKLSKQERIVVLVIAVIVILGVGIFMFLVPKWNEVSAAQKALDSKKVEYQNTLDKAALKDGLKQDIIDAYEEGRDNADMFFEEMTPYESDNEARAFIKYCQDKGINMVVESLNVGNPGVASLAVSFFADGTEINYDLKQYATQGQTKTEDEIAAEARRSILMSQLSGSQQVAVSNVSFTMTVLDEQEYLDFLDIVNNYVIEEDGDKIRKALMTDSLNMTYTDVTEKYNEIAAEMQVEIFDKAQEELKKNGGEPAEKIPNETNTPDVGANEDEEEENEKPTIENSLKTYAITLSFYSIERMQDPTEQLEAQDAV